MLFLIGLGIGLIVGTIAGVFIAALCFAARGDAETQARLDQPPSRPRLA